MKQIILGAASTVAWIVAVILLAYNFDASCESYIKLAGDAPNVERADEFLGKALSYIEENGLTWGNSALIFSTPQSDIGIWYGQIKGAKETTASILSRIKEGEMVSQLEKDNALMKIREVVLDETSDGTSVTTPDWITWFPRQWAMVIWLIASLALVIWGLNET